MPQGRCERRSVPLLFDDEVELRGCFHRQIAGVDGLHRSAHYNRTKRRPNLPWSERRRREELPPDIITLIASCGERIRMTDSIELRT
jgi:hypothetical protein